MMKRQAEHPPLTCVLYAHHGGSCPCGWVFCSQGLEQELRHPPPGSTMDQKGCPPSESSWGLSRAKASVFPSSSLTWCATGRT